MTVLLLRPLPGDAARRPSSVSQRDSSARPEPTDVSSILDDARVIREAIVELAFDIYEPLTEHPEVVYSRDELEALLKGELVGAILTGPIRTRNKLAKEWVCRALGYPIPTSFKRVKPRFPVA